MMKLPQIILNIVVELNWCLPAVTDGGLADILFVRGGDGATAKMVFVVTFAIEVVDKMLLQRVGYTGWHIVVDI